MKLPTAYLQADYDLVAENSNSNDKYAWGFLSQNTNISKTKKNILNRCPFECRNFNWNFSISESLHGSDFISFNQFLI